MIKTLSYDDVLLVPQYSDVRSRTEVSLESDLGNGLVLSSPILSSPMDTISEAPMATAMGCFCGAAIVHRYNSIQDQCRIITMSHEAAGIKVNVGAAVGISDDFLLRATMLINAGATFLCIDVAHGHHILMKEALAALREEVGPDFHIMAGNVATLEGPNDLADWGADSVRCNIGGGSICSTRVQTGHGMPGLQTIFECAKTDRDVAIIADGGLKNSGDMVKALAAGADAVMCGSLFAGTTEAPGEIYRDTEGTVWKAYRGMASKEAQYDWRGEARSLEGISTTIPYKGTVVDILRELEQNIRSGLSYSGARNLKELKKVAKFIKQSQSGQSESGTHILNVR